MLNPQTISRFDQVITVQSPTNDDADNERETTYSNTYTNVFAREVKASGGESTEESQTVSKQKRAWAIRKLDRSITTEMVVNFESEIWHITSVHPYGADRAHLVLECESRDND